MPLPVVLLKTTLFQEDEPNDLLRTEHATAEIRIKDGVVEINIETEKGEDLGSVVLVIAGKHRHFPGSIQAWVFDKEECDKDGPKDPRRVTLASVEQIEQARLAGYAKRKSRIQRDELEQQEGK